MKHKTEEIDYDAGTEDYSDIFKAPEDYDVEFADLDYVTKTEPTPADPTIDNLSPDVPKPNPSKLEAKNSKKKISTTKFLNEQGQYESDLYKAIIEEIKSQEV